MMSETLKELKRYRGAAKGNITRKARSIRTQMRDRRNVNVVLDMMKDIDVLVAEFQEVHEAYHVGVARDAVLTRDSLLYLEAELQDIENFTAEVTQWVIIARNLNDAEKRSTAADKIETVPNPAGEQQTLPNPEGEQQTVPASQQQVTEAEVHNDNHSVTTKASTVTGARAAAAARKASLLAEAANLQKKKDLEMEELIIQQKKQSLQIQTDIAKADAEERIYSQFDEEGSDQLHPKFDTIRKWRENVKPSAGANEHEQCETHHEECAISHASDTTEQLMHFLHQGQKQQQQLLDSMQLPRTEMMNFDGDPLKYWMFMQSFDNIVGRSTVDDSAKLARLLQYCTGKAYKAIQCCTAMGTADGYTTARKLLSSRFGNEFVIAEAWVKRITDGHRLKPTDREGLLDFADEVQSCRETLSAIGELSEVTNQQTLVKIIEKLPLYLINRWKREAHKIAKKHARGRTTFDDVVTFIRDAAEEANDPVFGTICMTDTPRDSTRKSQGKRTTHGFTSQVGQHDKGSTPAATGTSSVDKPVRSCPLCSASHSLFGCESFKKLSTQERYDFAREKKLCINCLIPGHYASRCRRDTSCTVPGCGRKHTKFLHLQRETPANNNGDSYTGNTDSNVSRTNYPTMYQRTPGNQASGYSGTDPGNGIVTGVGVHSTHSTSRNVHVALPIVPVVVKSSSGNDFVETYALLDNGSTNTFCSNELLDHLNLKHGPTETLSLTTLESKDCVVETTVVSLDITDLDGKSTINLPHVYAKRDLPINMNIVRQEDCEKWAHLRDISFPKLSMNKVTLLIGQDVPEALVPLEVRSGNRGEPYATRTALGWTINGPTSMQHNHRAVVNFVTMDRLESQVQKFWEIEGDELLSDNKLSMSQNDKHVLNIWNDTICHTDGHYEMAIPFKQRPLDLPCNKPVAARRLELLGRRLKRDKTLHTNYRDGINELLDSGYAVQVPEEELQPEKGTVWYLPHHPVINPNKPDKVRIVFDCAATYHGTSLNDQVHKGPDLMNNLIGVLLRFREQPVAMMADIKGMFHQVKVSPSDCDTLRFLWWPDGDVSRKPTEYKMVVHLFGGVWSPSCANFTVRRTVEDNQLDFDTETANTVYRNFYVDDCLKSVQTEEQAIRLSNQLFHLLARGGFHLTKWISNSINLLQHIPEELRAKTVKDLDQVHDPLTVNRALGVLWDVQTDCLGFKCQVKDKPPTKRAVLSIVSSIFDPLGFLSPFILTAKLILQQLCRLKLDWDDTLPPEELHQWLCWLSDLPTLRQFKIDRCLKPPAVGDYSSLHCQLHNFADASQSGYGVVCYLRLVDPTGNIHCQLVMSKSRLAPIKAVTIPRLELTAATLAVKMDRMLQEELDIPLQSSIFWTDSTIVLQYINNTDKRFNTFVANRLSVIHDNSLPEQWRHVSGDANPADDASRGLSADRMVSSQTWLHGPDFLQKDPSKWPEVPNYQKDNLIPSEEIKKPVTIYSTSTDSDDVLKRLMDRYSDWYILKRSVAWLLRFKNKLLQRIRKPDTDLQQSGSLTVAELNSAEVAIVRYLQVQCFSDEIQALTGGATTRQRVKKSSRLHRLEPIMLESGVLGVTGRLEHASIATEAKHQMILPKDHHVVNLIIEHYHQQAGHSGKEHVLSLLRQKFWILNGRATVARVLNSCRHCKRRTAPPGEQRMADLPKDRVTPDHPPFTFVGVDYFGPFTVKRGRSLVKRYGCLFTCLATRAIHLEVAHSLDMDSFMNALQRFISRRGQPIEIRSDNGTNFVGAERELRRSITDWNQGKLHDFLRQRNIQWVFNPPYASHMGGVWERQIRTIRKLLIALLTQQTLDDEGLTTLMCLAEGIVNSRPITAVSNDSRDPEPLTPNHLLLLRSGAQLPPGIFHADDMYGRKRWRHVQYLADLFWRRWVKEYLPALQQRQKWVHPHRNLVVDDVVLLIEEKTPRNLWPMGRVSETFPGKDGLVRSVRVKSRSSSFVRPIDKLCLLEPI